MSEQAEILANLEQMVARQTALAEKRMREAEERLHQMRKVQDFANHLARYAKGIDINPVPNTVHEPTSRDWVSAEIYTRIAYCLQARRLDFLGRSETLRPVGINDKYFSPPPSRALNIQILLKL